MNFDFYADKITSNKTRHGISFVEAQALWDDLDLLEIPAKTVEDENRCLVIGRIGLKHWSADITYRDDAVRIISVRRSKDKEVAYYESTGF